MEIKETPIRRVTLEFEPNTFDKHDWWFDLGISASNTPYHPDHRYVFTVSLIFYTVYVRWGRWNRTN